MVISREYILPTAFSCFSFSSIFCFLQHIPMHASPSTLIFFLGGVKNGGI